MKKPCDCLNVCGDDEDVYSGIAEPCAISHLKTVKPEDENFGEVAFARLVQDCALDVLWRLRCRYSVNSQEWIALKEAYDAVGDETCNAIDGYLTGKGLSNQFSSPHPSQDKSDQLIAP